MTVIDRSAYLNKSDLIEPETIKDKIPDQQQLHRVLLIVCFITFAASYNFGTYNFFADIIRLVFFADVMNIYQLAGRWQVAIVIAIGFLVRPIGAYYAGYFGSRKGRKPAIYIAITVSAIATLMSALLPDYSQIGVWAVGLLLIARLGQGMAFGAQLCLSWIYVAETLSRKPLSIYLSVVSASIVLGTLTSASVLTVLEIMFDPAQMQAYGWRIAFMIGAFISLGAVLLSRYLDETPLFLKWQQQRLDASFPCPPLPMLKRFPALLLTALLGLIFSSIMVLTFSLLPRLIALEYSIDALSLRQAQLTGMLGLALGMVFYGWLSDKFSLSYSLMIGTMLLGTQVIFFYVYLNSSQGNYLIPAYGLFGFLGGVIALCPVIFVQMFNTRLRLFVVGLIFNVMALISGALLRFVLIYSTSIISFAPALYVIFICICAFTVGFLIYHSQTLNQLETIPNRSF